jgi:hypothetical protein
MGVYPLLLSPASEEGEAKQHEFNDMAYADVTNPTGLPRAFTFAKLANSKAFHDNENVVELSIAGSSLSPPSPTLYIIITRVILGHQETGSSSRAQNILLTFATAHSIHRS